MVLRVVYRAKGVLSEAPSQWYAMLTTVWKLWRNIERRTRSVVVARRGHLKPEQILASESNAKERVWSDAWLSLRADSKT